MSFKSNAVADITEALFQDAPFPHICDRSFVKIISAPVDTAQSCQDAFKRSFGAAESGMTVMCNLRVLANVIYPPTLQRWDHRHRQTYYELGGYAGLSMAAAN